MNRMRPRVRGNGFTIIELMIVVMIIGFIAATALPAFSRYTKRSRTAEAAGHLSKIFSGATTYFNTEHADNTGNTMDNQFPGGIAPDDADTECGCQPTGKCAGNSTAFGDPIWVALSFSVPSFHDYRPAYEGSGVGSASIFTATAHGDLDCDGVLSTFQRLGSVGPTGDVAGGSTAFVDNEIE